MWFYSLLLTFICCYKVGSEIEALKKTEETVAVLRASLDALLALVEPGLQAAEEIAYGNKYPLTAAR